MMFREDIYCELRDDFELCEMEGGDKEPFLCKFMREEKERDIRLLIRKDRLKIADSQGRASMAGSLQKLLEDMLDFMEQNPKSIEKCGQKKDLLRLMGIEEGVSLKKAIEQKREEIDIFLEGKDENELERQKKDLVGAGKIMIRSLDDEKEKNPYIALRKEYLDYRLHERTRDEVLAKARSIYQRKYAVGRDIKMILQAKAEVSDPEELEEAVKQLSSAILKTEAKAFLYDAGFPLLRMEMQKKKRAGADRMEETSDYREKKTARKNDRAVNLIGSYCDSRGISVSGKTAIFSDSCFADIDSDEFKDAAEKLYHALEKSDRTKAFVPLYIDGKSGVGLYIIGSENIPESSYHDKQVYRAKRDEEEIRRRKSCHYCCVSGFELVNDKDSKELSLTLRVEICDKIGRAIEIYKTQRISGYDVYAEQNGRPVEDMDERFLPYFDTE